MSNNNKYNPNKIERKWQEIWQKTKLYETDLKDKNPKHYNLVMFPYPSGEYLHMGHAYSYSGADVYGRYKKLKGFNVFEPIGYDSFGLPAENFAIRNKVHPKESTAKNIEHSEKQLKAWGCMFDWSKTVTTSEPDYYKWTQWLFLKLYKMGLAYQKEAPVNWCPKCLTVLAHEQVISGLCERCETEVIQKMMKQWFFKTTDYAEKLIKDLDKVDWPGSSKIKQRNWIGKSEGVEFEMEISGQKEKISTYTTRIDTVFGITYVVLAPEHELVSKITTKEQKKEVEEYQAKTQKLTDIERQSLEKEKTGVFTGAYAINPFNNKKVPIWIADYALLSYGTGAVMAVPAHDERDFEFAKKYKLEIIPVVLSNGSRALYWDEKKQYWYSQKYTDEWNDHYANNGKLVASAEFSGLTSEEAKEKMAKWLEKKKIGGKKINYRLRDWSIGRQRYWGAPIPIIYCEKCGTVPVPGKDLPVLLPDLEVKDIQPRGTGKGPLASILQFVKTTCPKCGGKAERETDTMDTFVCSSFYFMRYPSVGNDKQMMEPGVTKKWLPVDMYIGGAEHVTMHLLYARFITKALYDAKLIDFDEPFMSLRHQGMILGPDGRKMSKSKGNVVIPDEVIKKDGADAFRTFILFMGPFDEGGPWNPQGIKGVKRFLERYWALAMEVIKGREKAEAPTLRQESSAGVPTDSVGKIEETALQRLAHKTVKKVGEDIENFRFNTAVSSMMGCLNEMLEIKEKLPPEKSPLTWHDVIDKFTLVLSPFAPHLTEEVWEKTGHRESVFVESWPEYNKDLIKEEIVTLVVQVNGKLRDTIQVKAGLAQEDAEKEALGSQKIQKNLNGKKPIKTIYVPDKLLNIIIK